ncbi:sialidase family protein, partial [Fusobacterium sp.]|uniref:sialidase family protein n=1 Tax=Fusobacterium sp. TaxID=68766 RepID=UPI00260C0450
MKKLTLLTLFCALATGAMAGDGWNESMTVFKHGSVTDKNGFRIPAITATSQGTLVAVSDIRYAGLTGNTDMPQKVEFSIKTSTDGGSTWSEGKIIAPSGGITDPSIVHDPNTGKTFLFGYNNNSSIATSNGKSDFFVYTSDDGGKTWDKGQSIKNDSLPNGYKLVLQGPGSGMVHNGVIYMATQAWHGDADGGKGLRCSSGFIF